MSFLIALNEKDLLDILDGMVDGVITINQRGIILSFNKTAETMFGYKSEETIGENVRMLMPEPDSKAHDSYLHNHLTTGVAHVIGIGRDVTGLRKNNEKFPMQLSVIECPAKVEGDRWFIGSCRDITLQKKQTEQLDRRVKMEALGKLTSSIAHDYNNALSIIMGYSELLALLSKDNPEFQDYTSEITKAAKRATNITQKLLSISRKRVKSAEAININDMLDSCQDLLANTLTSQIKLSLKPADDLWISFADKSSLDDVLLNMTINAKHAMPEGGELHISTSNVQMGAVDAQVLNIPMGDYVKLMIEDTGTGMTEKVASHIFEPFYSTKGEKGTGLGLSQVYNFVIESKGTIRVYSEPGYGTCFSIFLPRYSTQQSTDKSKDAIISEGDLNSSATILVVDDVRSIRNVTEYILSSKGYVVFCASSAKEALAMLETETIDLVLSDVIMPELDGFELAHIIQHTYPDIKIQLCSGMPNVKGKSVTNELLCQQMLIKPFSAEQLMTSVQKLLDK